MVEDSGVPRWRREHCERALDVGVPLIPTDSKQDRYPGTLSSVNRTASL